MKILIRLIIVLNIVLLSNITFASSNSDISNIKVLFDEIEYTYKDKPIEKNDRTLFPLRETLINLGIKNDNEHIIWDESKNSVNIKSVSVEIVLTVNSKTAYVDSKLDRATAVKVNLDTPPTIYNDKVYIPIRFIAQTLGKKVIWNETTSTISISEPKAKKGSTYLWPVPGNKTIIKNFGERNHPGIHINAPRGSNIIASNEGIVIASEWISGYGYTVIIDHGNGISTLYAHCMSIGVTLGQGVATGDVIAKIGSTGTTNDAAPLLQFEVRKYGEPEDPLKYISTQE